MVHSPPLSPTLTVFLVVVRLYFEAVYSPFLEQKSGFVPRTLERGLVTLRQIIFYSVVSVTLSGLGNTVTC